MDYDNNDFEGHNIRLAGEGSSKLSPVSSPYALPKFHFDDNLQSHIRFDNLVENEVFLGISSEEDDQWIEDFSQGSSVIKFSSSATDSCPVSRPNNVWSEATSSESVAMLLKSVGQEEKIVEETILTEEMEPNPNQVNKEEDAIQSKPASAPDDFPDGSNESGLVDNPNVECTLEDQKDDHFHRSSAEAGSNAEIEGKCNDANQMEVSDSLEESLVVNVKELPSKNVIASSGELNDQDKYQVASSGGCKIDEDSPVICPSNESHEGRAVEVIDAKAVSSSSVPELDIGAEVEMETLESDSQVDGNVVVEASALPRVDKEDFFCGGQMAAPPSSEQGGVHSCDQDVSFHEKGDAEVAVKSSEMECRNDGSEGNTRIAHRLEFNSSTGNEPESKVVVEDTNLSSCDTLNGHPSGTSITADEVTSHIHGQKSSVLGVLSVDNEVNKKMDIEVHEGTILSDPKESLEVPTDLEHVPKVPVTEAGQESSKTMEDCSVDFDSTLKQVDGSEAAGCHNSKDISLERDAEVELVEVADATLLSNKDVVPDETTISVSMVEPCCDMSQKDSDATVACGTQTTGQIGPITKDFAVDSLDDHQASVPLTFPSKDGDTTPNLGKYNCVSPTVISCTENTRSEKGQQVGIEGSKVNNVLHSETTFNHDGKVKSVSLHTGSDASKEETSFTFDVSPSTGLSEAAKGKGLQSFPGVHDVDGSSLTPGTIQIDLKMAPEISPGSVQAPVVGGVTPAGAKVTPERKTRRSSGKAAARNAKKGKHVKETPPMVFTGSPGPGQLLQFEELKSPVDVELSSTKPRGVLPIPTSNLPDLNTSVPPAAFSQQPFTDLQQVQLRAQIFVYGSLMQETAPDEACMISAFGPSGGGNLWEPAWRACVERVNAQKTRASNSETPVPSRPVVSELKNSGTKGADKSAKRSSLKGSVVSSPVNNQESSSKSSTIPSPVANPIIPLSSPLWNVSTTPSFHGLQSSGMPRGALVDYHQPFSTLHPYQPPGARNFVGQSPSWLSQAQFPGSWMAAPQTSMFDTSARFSMFPNTEPVKLTPAKDSTAPTVSATKHTSPLDVAHAGAGASVSSGTSSQPDPKSRKKKKVPVTDGLGLIPLPILHQSTSVSDSGVSNHLSKRSPIPEVIDQTLLGQSQTESFSTAAVSNLLSTSTSNSRKVLESVSPTSLSGQPRRVDHQNMEKSKISEETVNTVEEAKLQAETAAAHAAAAVGHCHDVWSQLSNQKVTGLPSDDESKLASAAMAIAAAASVAKAAAAAAKIASDIAAQTKVVADEVSFSNVTRKSTHSTGSSSVIAVAKEAAKKRVEAASAASKHAENLDAIVKAAELAAEAVSQAGKIVSIGDPLSLSQLVESGPVGYWKNSPVEHGAKSHIEYGGDQPKAVSNVEELRVSPEQFKGPSGMEKETGKPGTVTNLEKGSSRAQNGTSELAKTSGVVPESEAGSRSASVIAEDASRMMIDNGMKEGCLVEVFKDGGHYKAAWYSASILNLKDGKAFICYTELQANDRSGQLKEWVPLEGDGIKAPTMRIAHPMTSMRLDGGTRKRRRAAVLDYTWSVGDKVDVWMEDCWREGVVKEKNSNDVTTLTVHIPALGETTAVRAWYLRPTLTWQDGQWIECSSARLPSPFQGDTPQEKRKKVGSPIAAKEKDKVSSGISLVESRKQVESELLPLSVNERHFHVGKNTRPENKLGAQRTMKTGLQKEGSSRVVFGVPKPGKKRKFMDDVSKNLDSDQSSKNLKTSDSVKFARYLIPQGSGVSRGWKNNSKIDAKEKLAAATGHKSKVLRSGKPVAKPANIPKQIPEDASNAENNNLGDKQNLMEFGSSSNSQDTSEGPALVYSRGRAQVAPKKAPLRNMKPERVNEGRSAPGGGRLPEKMEVQEKSIPEVVEPRRSVRKIQPTSRLLEGLQSSLTMSKMPSVSHDKRPRSQIRSKSQREQ